MTSQNLMVRQAQQYIKMALPLWRINILFILKYHCICNSIYIFTYLPAWVYQNIERQFNKPVLTFDRLPLVFLCKFHWSTDVGFVGLYYFRHPHHTLDSKVKKWICLRCFILTFLSTYTDFTSVYLWADNKWGCQLGHKMAQR